jgi:small-conductance mechanosensitive channel
MKVTSTPQPGKNERDEIDPKDALAETGRERQLSAAKALLEQELIDARNALADAVSARDAARRASHLELVLIARLQRQIARQSEENTRLKNELVHLRNRVQKGSGQTRFLRRARSSIARLLRAVGV